MTRLGRALFAVGENVPERFRRFDALIDESALSVDLEEYSARIGGEHSAYRATYYFDVGRREAGLARPVGELFVRQAAELGVPLGAEFLGFFAEIEAETRPSVLQLVLGIDDRGVSAAYRQKIYFVLQPSAGDFVRRVLGRLSIAAAPTLPLDLVYIVGLDFDASGFSDAKLYFALDRARVPKIADLSAHLDLFAGSRLVVLQHRLSNGGRQVFFHADAPDVVWHLLERRAASDTSARELFERAHAMSESLAQGRLEPWIVAFPFAERRIETNACTVYFHVGK